MSQTLFNLARMTVSSSGTGSITLNAAVTGFLTFDLAGCSTASTGQPVTYAINDTTQSEIGRGTYYSSGPTLTRGSSTNGLKSTNSNSPINMSNAAQVFVTPSANDLNNIFGQCYLQETSNSTITLVPYQGNKLTINYVNETIPDAGVALASTAASLSSTTAYYIYAYMSSGTMTLEPSTTAYAAQAGTGVSIKSGDGTRTLVGMWLTSNSTSWSTTDTCGASWFNPKRKTTYASASVTSTQVAATELDTALRVNFVSFSGRPNEFSMQILRQGTDTIGQDVISFVALDGATNMLVSELQPRFDDVFANLRDPAYASLNRTDVTEGFHYTTAMGYVSGGTGTWTVFTNIVTITG